MPGNTSFSQSIHGKLKNKGRAQKQENSQIQSSCSYLWLDFCYVLLGPTFPSKYTKLKNILLLGEIHSALTKAGEKMR